MWQYLAKILITSVAVVAVAELGKRNALWGAILASLPLTSLLAFVWLYAETGSAEKVAVLSGNIFWLVLPSLALFVALPLLIRAQVPFWLSLSAACLTTVVAYFGMVWLLGRFHIRI